MEQLLERLLNRLYCFLSIFPKLLVVQESDMELDLLGDSESDSEESTHSHADNASVQRSAITAATAGSDAGKLGCCILSDSEHQRLYCLFKWHFFHGNYCTLKPFI